MLDHVSIQCAYLAASTAFYDAVLAPLGVVRIRETSTSVGYGTPPKPDFWIDAKASGDGFRETHVAFVATTRRAVDDFFNCALAMGAEALHSPRLWPRHHESYYGAFVRDPDGNNIEAVCHTPE